MVRVAIYTRVSTEDQAKEGFSLGAQRERLEAYCTARDWEIVATYVDDGYSGRDTRRPAYQRIMEERDRWDTILVIKMDRIHRNSRNFMEMMDNLRSWGKDFASATESLDTSTAMGRFVMDIIQRIAQLESEQIGERVYMGMAQKAKHGPGILGFQPPLGYRIASGQLFIEPAEASVVRRIFDLALQGKTLEKIASVLNDRDRVLTKRKTRWTAVKVYRILHNPVYAGFLRWDGLLRKGDHEALVAVDAFNQVQELLRSRALPDVAREGPLALEA
ncbi:MAG: site-specific recombinase [Euryarchaeota archaeon RBG_19FT_COMBO_69_17]|uniref:Site-specific recombinase for integration and excision n=2 Tax=environmental samples TaxID=68359 RepID=A0A0H4TMC1_9EURY|nr:Site-specific recombinase for integration and excision [uncultured euryarchaeote Rifle_16ft_4_minimus_23719]AKQ02735.1 Site-specific recombinase for integration and excision [uncultured euryarchaeote Rifle_16ft_4_minimus_37664]OGS62120.1 MAG: site-specific recombinase [Euryarchaeota archaeon RBG_19FT_COMBO_69_17]